MLPAANCDALVEIRLRLRQREVVERSLLGRAEAQRHFLNGGRDQEEIRGEVVGEKGGGEVLVDDRGDAVQIPVLVGHDRDAAAARRDHHDDPP